MKIINKNFEGSLYLPSSDIDTMFNMTMSQLTYLPCKAETIHCLWQVYKWAI